MPRNSGYQGLRSLVNGLNHRQLYHANWAEDFYDCLKELNNPISRFPRRG